MIKKILVTFSLVISSIVFADQIKDGWTKAFVDSDHSEYFINFSKIRKLTNPKHKEVWVKQVYKESLEGNINDGDYKVSKIRVECDENSLKYVSSFAYNNNGSTLGSQSFDIPFNEPPPDSVGAKLIEVTCKFPVKMSD